MLLLFLVGLLELEGLTRAFLRLFDLALALVRTAQIVEGQPDHLRYFTCLSGCPRLLPAVQDVQHGLQKFLALLESALVEKHHREVVEALDQVRDLAD